MKKKLRKTNYKRSLFIAFLIISLILILKFIRIENYVNLETFKENREHILNFVKVHYFYSVFIYIILYLVICSLSIPITAFFTIMGGFLFNVFPCVIYTNIGATIGSSITFLIFRYLLGNIIQEKFKTKLIKLNRNIELYGTNYLIIVRLIAAIPFFLANILISLTKIPLKTFIWTTSLGIIPGSIIFAYAGKQIVNLNSINEIFSPKIILAFLILILFGLMSIFLKKSKKI